MVLYHQVFWELPCQLTHHPSFFFLKQNQKRCRGLCFLLRTLPGGVCWSAVSPNLQTARYEFQNIKPATTNEGTCVGLSLLPGSQRWAVLRWGEPGDAPLCHLHLLPARIWHLQRQLRLVWFCGVLFVGFGVICLCFGWFVLLFVITVLESPQTTPYTPNVVRNTEVNIWPRPTQSPQAFWTTGVMLPVCPNLPVFIQGWHNSWLLPRTGSAAVCGWLPTSGSMLCYSGSMKHPEICRWKSPQKRKVLFLW